LGCSSDDSVVQNPDIANIKLQISFTVVDMQVSDLSGKSNLSGKTNKGSTLTDKQEWEHIFEEGLAIEFTNTKTKKVYTLPYDPSNPSAAYSIQLPFGSYSYKLESFEGFTSPLYKYQNYLPFEAVGNLEVADTEMVLNLIAQTDYGLVTVDAYNINRARLSPEKSWDASTMPYTPSKDYYYKYVKSGLSPNVSILTAFQEYLDYQLPTIRALKRYNLLLGQNELNNINFILADFEQEDYYFIGDDEDLQDNNSNSTNYKIEYTTQLSDEDLNLTITWLWTDSEGKVRWERKNMINPAANSIVADEKILEITDMLSITFTVNGGSNVLTNTTVSVTDIDNNNTFEFTDSEPIGSVGSSVGRNTLVISFNADNNSFQ